MNVLQQIHRSLRMRQSIGIVLFLATSILWFVPIRSAGKTLADELLVGPGYRPGLSVVGLDGGNNWNGPWRGAFNEAKLQPSGPGAMQIQIDTTTKECSLSRQLKKPVGIDETCAWMSFSIKKDSGISKFGLSFRSHSQERLFVGVPEKREAIFLGSNAAFATSARTAHLAVVCISFHQGHDRAYLFLDPSPAAVPDLEDANAVCEGGFSFDEIQVIAGGGLDGAGVSGSVGPIRLGTQFGDVISAVEPAGKRELATNDKLEIVSWRTNNGALDIRMSGGVLELQPCFDRILHIQFGTDAAIKAFKSYAVPNRPPSGDFEVADSADAITLRTSQYHVKVIRATSQLQFYNAANDLLLQELPQDMRPRVKNGSMSVSGRFQLTPAEAIYGLGEFRDGNLNLRGKRRELVQMNTQAAVPVLLSVNGWGLFWDNPSRTVFADDKNGMSFDSDLGGSLSYYLFCGDKLDDLVQQYRQLTGASPMLPRWAFGYHQSRNRYGSQQKVLSVVSEMRKQNIPMDSIFVDYFYWGKYGVGSHQFDETQFPDVRKMVDRLHKMHAKMIVTLWPAFLPGTSNYAELHKAGFLLDGATALGGTIYDPFNPQARLAYWNQVNKGLGGLGIDGWFLDGPEPDNVASFLETRTFAGPASEVRNLYPLVHSTAVYNGLRAAQPDKRPYIITRCAWASQQRNSTAVWSGDIDTTFVELKKQIMAGLNFVASGIPYWTTDIGGYRGGNPANPGYRELYTRWWEYGTFCPIFRSHGRRESEETGAAGENELMAFGTNVQMICTQFDDLRYRLLPYIYSVAWDVTSVGYTPMRLLAFDFKCDTNGYNIKDEFMFGPAILVSPVTDAGARSRVVYLPNGTKWTDFWTGDSQPGGRRVRADAPINKIPIFIRAGAIVPMEPISQHTEDQTADSLELRIYPGADGAFELFDDDGVTFGYERGQSSLIRFAWDDASRTFTIGAAKGKYVGMPASRTFKIVVVTTANGAGLQEGRADALVKYVGNECKIQIP